MAAEAVAGEGGKAPSPDPTRAKLRTGSHLADAVRAWEGKLRTVADSPPAAITLTFSPGLKDVRAFHDTVAAMGVQVCYESAAGVAAPQRKLPYATIAGDVHQPCLIVIWKAAPEERTSIQFRPSKGVLTAKTRRSVIRGRMQLFLAFLGPAIDVAGSAPRGRAKRSEVDLLKAMAG